MSLRLEKEIKMEPVVPWEDISCLLWHNGMLFTTVTSNYDTSTGCNGKVHALDKDLKKIGEFQAHKYGIYHMCAGPGDTIYTCASDSTICHWKFSLEKFSSGQRKACSVQNTIPGRGPLFVSRDKVFCLHRTTFDIMVYSLKDNGNPLITSLSDHCSLVNAFVGSEDILFSGDYDGKIIVLDLLNLTKSSELDLKQNGCINAMTYDFAKNILYVAQEGKNLAKYIHV